MRRRRQVIGSQGLYVDLSDVEDRATVEDAIADFTEHRALIEQAKGILMVTYRISAERAFDILRVAVTMRSNTKLRKLASQLIDDFTVELHVPAGIRERADHVTADRAATGVRTPDASARLPQRRLLTAETVRTGLRPTPGTASPTPPRSAAEPRPAPAPVTHSRKPVATILNPARSNARDTAANWVTTSLQSRPCSIIAMTPAS